MKYIEAHYFRFLLFTGLKLFVLTLIARPVLASACECKPFECNSCEQTESLEFYTTKCELSGKFMSCSKPKCVALDPLPEFCVAKGESKSRSIASTPKIEAPKETPSTQIEVGEIVRAVGKAWVLDGIKRPKQLMVGNKIYKSDKIKTGPNGKIQILFKDKNVLNLSPGTELSVSDYQVGNGTNSRRALFKLLRGKVRSKVKNKYKGTKSSHFRVQTSSAVAGVRGTDFVVSFNVGDKEVTKVHTLSGEVSFGEVRSAENIKIRKGQYASFVAVRSEVFDQEDINEFVRRGYFTPIYEMSQQDIAKVDWQTNFKKKGTHSVEPSSPARNLSGVGSICTNPEAQFNMCSWSCHNNPKGEKRCRTDLKTVSCLRKRCNANGEWSEENRLPASRSGHCEAKGIKVAPCDY